MVNITKIPHIINHLKQYSSSYKETSGEIIIFCPYCDDSTRTKADHGHLYISKTMPVFNCFRCSSSGNIVRLLIDIGFHNEEILNYLAKFIKYKAIKDYYKQSKKQTNLKLIKDQCISRNLLFESKNKHKFEIYKDYIYSRIGKVDFSNFLISPSFFKNILSCTFTNNIGEDVVIRLIENYKDMRYHLNMETSGHYMFQEPISNKYQQIVLAEGPFDIINLYLYNNIEFNNCFFIAVNGKKYISIIEYLIIKYFLLKSIEINLVFDNDVRNYKQYLFRAKALTKQFNQNIIIRGWQPIIKKDTGDFPGITEVFIER